MEQAALLSELKPVVERLFDRHLQSTKEWFPHEHVPHSRGRDFDEGEEWSPEQADLAGAELSDAVRSALYVNLLTEDNLPYYALLCESRRMLSPWLEKGRGYAAAYKGGLSIYLPIGALAGSGGSVIRITLAQQPHSDIRPTPS